MILNKIVVITLISSLRFAIANYPGQEKDALDPEEQPNAHPPSYYALTPEQITDITNRHNGYRELHVDTPDLTWDDKLAADAEEFVAQYNCSSGSIYHSDLWWGENIAIGYTLDGAVDAWYNEIRNWNYSHPVWNDNIGHFSQVVWKDTKNLGCAIRYCNSYWGSLLVCEYNPPGNYDNEMGSEIMPLKAMVEKSTTISSSLATSTTSTFSTFTTIILSPLQNSTATAFRPTTLAPSKTSVSSSIKSSKLSKPTRYSPRSASSSSSVLSSSDTTSETEWLTSQIGTLSSATIGKVSTIVSSVDDVTTSISSFTESSIERVVRSVNDIPIYSSTQPTSFVDVASSSFDKTLSTFIEASTSNSVPDTSSDIHITSSSFISSSIPKDPSSSFATSIGEDTNSLSTSRTSLSETAYSSYVSTSSTVSDLSDQKAKTSTLSSSESSTEEISSSTLKSSREKELSSHSSDLTSNIVSPTSLITTSYASTLTSFDDPSSLLPSTSSASFENESTTLDHPSSVRSSFHSRSSSAAAISSDSTSFTEKSSTSTDDEPISLSSTSLILSTSKLSGLYQTNESTSSSEDSTWKEELTKTFTFSKTSSTAKMIATSTAVFYSNSSVHHSYTTENFETSVFDMRSTIATGSAHEILPKRRGSSSFEDSTSSTIQAQSITPTFIKSNSVFTTVKSSTSEDDWSVTETVSTTSSSSVTSLLSTDVEAISTTSSSLLTSLLSTNVETIPAHYRSITKNSAVSAHSSFVTASRTTRYFSSTKVEVVSSNLNSKHSSTLLASNSTFSKSSDASNWSDAPIKTDYSVHSKTDTTNSFPNSTDLPISKTRTSFVLGSSISSIDSKWFTNSKSLTSFSDNAVVSRTNVASTKITVTSVSNSDGSRKNTTVSSTQTMSGRPQNVESLGTSTIIFKETVPFTTITQSNGVIEVITICTQCHGSISSNDASTKQNLLTTVRQPDGKIKTITVCTQCVESTKAFFSSTQNHNSIKASTQSDDITKATTVCAQCKKSANSATTIIASTCNFSAESSNASLSAENVVSKNLARTANISTLSRPNSSVRNTVRTVTTSTFKTRSDYTSRTFNTNKPEATLIPSKSKSVTGLCSTSINEFSSAITQSAVYKDKSNASNAPSNTVSTSKSSSAREMTHKNKDTTNTYEYKITASSSITVSYSSVYPTSTSSIMEYEGFAHSFRPHHLLSICLLWILDLLWLFIL